MSIVTHNADHGFKANMRLKKDASIILYMRAVAKAQTDSEITLDDAAILSIVNSVDGDDAAAEQQRVNLILQAIVSETKEEIIEEETDEDDEEAVALTPAQIAANAVKVHNLEAQAKAFAAEADGNNSLGGVIERGVMAKQDTAMTMLRWYQALKAQYGDKLLSLPIPNSTEKTHPDNPDIYKRPSKRKGAGGSGQSSYLNYFADNLKWVRENIGAKLLEAEEVKKQSKKRGIAMETKYKGQEATVRVNVKGAVMLAHQLALAAKYPAVIVEFAQEKGADGKMIDSDTAAPIWISDKANPKVDFVDYTVAQFNQLDFAKATAKGGSYDDLLGTLNRPAKSPETQPIDTQVKFQSAMALALGFIEQTPNWLALQAMIVGGIQGTDKEKHDMALNYAITLEKLDDKISTIVSAVRKEIDAYYAAQKAAQAARKAA